MKHEITGMIRKKVKTEPFAGKLGLKVTALEPGYAKVEMKVTPSMANIFGAAHGGAIFSLIDEAFAEIDKEEIDPILSITTRAA